MWFLDFMPNFLIHTLLTVGIAGIVLGFFISVIPFVNQYKLPIQIISILLLAFGLYLEGGIAYKEKTAKEIAELKEKLADASAKSEKTNVQIVTKVVKDTKIVKQKGEQIIKIVEKEVEKFNDQCVIPKEVIELHNRAISINTDVLEEKAKEQKTKEVKEEPKKEETNKIKLPARTAP